MSAHGSNGSHPDATVGIIANPMSGRDIRRLVARASVFPNSEKANMVIRAIAAAGALGVGRVLVSTDGFGVAGSVLREYRRRVEAGDTGWPVVEFCELPMLTGTAADTRETVRRMRADGAAVLMVLGGDGTVRAATAASGSTPVLPLSTGTNNAFPQVWEATVAGTAAALVATGAVDPAEVTSPAKVLHVGCGSRREIALVDVCVSTAAHIGAKALWQTDTLRELYCAFAEPHAIGLSSIAGLLLPTARTDPAGVRVGLSGGGPAERSVLAPIAPGVLARVGITEVAELPQAERRTSAVTAGTVAVDGERELEIRPGEQVTVTLSGDGPLILDVATVLRAAGEQQLLVSQEPVRPVGG